MREPKEKSMVLDKKNEKNKKTKSEQSESKERVSAVTKSKNKCIKKKSLCAAFTRVQTGLGFE